MPDDTNIPEGSVNPFEGESRLDSYKPALTQEAIGELRSRLKRIDEGAAARLIVKVEEAIASKKSAKDIVDLIGGILTSAAGKILL